MRSTNQVDVEVLYVALTAFLPPNFARVETPKLGSFKFCFIFNTGLTLKKKQKKQSPPCGHTLLKSLDCSGWGLTYILHTEVSTPTLCIQSSHHGHASSVVKQCLIQNLKVQGFDQHP